MLEIQITDKVEKDSEIFFFVNKSMGSLAAHMALIANLNPIVWLFSEKCLYGPEVDVNFAPRVQFNRRDKVEQDI